MKEFTKTVEERIFKGGSNIAENVMGSTEAIKKRVVARFAPSPTGLLHVGNARTALINWLYIQSLKKSHSLVDEVKFILRIDDTDVIRSKERYKDAIKKDLKWLCIEWDDTFEQSTRMESYRVAIRKLIDLGRLYPCYESEEELAIKRKSQQNQGLPPTYDRSALRLTKKEREHFEAMGLKPHWRFMLNDKDVVEWMDVVRGHIKFDKLSISDPVLIRADGSMTYMLCSVVDDIECCITHIIRGEDHITNSAVHIQLLQALGVQSTDIPRFGHVSLLTTKNNAISKRSGGFDLQTLREFGVEALALNSLLAKIGTSDSVELVSNMQNLIDEFDIAKFGKSKVIYDEEELMRLNAKMVHNMSYGAVQERLEIMGLKNVTSEFWDVVKNNISTLNEIKLWWRICCLELEPLVQENDLEFTKQISTKLPQGSKWNENTWNEWMNEIKLLSERRGKNLFMPIRIALTGLENGPELRLLLPLIGYEKAYARLNGRKA